MSSYVQLVNQQLNFILVSLEFGNSYKSIRFCLILFIIVKGKSCNTFVIVYSEYIFFEIVF